MRRTHAVLIMLLFGKLLAGCTSGGTWRPDPPPRPTDPVLGRWDIIPIAVAPFSPNENGWKTVRIPIAIENHTNRFAHAQIPVPSSLVYTNQLSITNTMPVGYPAELWETRGFNTTRVYEINYLSAGPIPSGLRIIGVYANDAISSYFFQARIPTATAPASLVVPGYPDPISLGQKTATSIPVASEPPKPQNRQVSIPGKAILSVKTLTSVPQNETSYNHVAHDRIAVTVMLTSTNPAYDSNVDLRATAIGERGILGSPLYDDVIGCAKPPFTVGPIMTITRTLCTIIPYDSHKVRVILTGDVNEIYDQLVSIK